MHPEKKKHTEVAQIPEHGMFSLFRTGKNAEEHILHRKVRGPMVSGRTGS